MKKYLKINSISHILKLILTLTLYSNKKNKTYFHYSFQRKFIGKKNTLEINK